MISPVLERPVTDRRSDATRPWWGGEVAVVVVLLVVYDHLRSLAGVHRASALAHGSSLLGAERRLSLDVESTFNHWLAAQQGIMPWASVAYYQFMHIGVALVVLAWCYLRRPDLYRPARNALVVTNVIGLIVFAVCPVAPPRLLPGGGFVDMVADAGFGTSHGPIPINEFGAMPSLHLAWAIWVTLVGLSMTETPWLGSLLTIHPLITAGVVVGTGNHYVADVVAGVALGVVAAMTTGLWRPWATAAVGVVEGVGPEGSPRRRHPTGRPSDRAEVGRLRAKTLVSFHAHPDDESMLTGGTLARAAAEGHRTVVVVATLGEAGLTGPSDDTDGLGSRRMAELRAAAAALGCARVEWLGYDDSGRDGRRCCDRPFVTADLDEAAARLAALLRDESADILTTYDPAGGYGHPDHRRVEQVGRRAAELAGTPVVLEATVDRIALLRIARVLRFVPGLPTEFRPHLLASSFSDRSLLTHRVDVRSHLEQKRAAMAAHHTQQTGGPTPRSLSVYLRLPRPVFRWVFGHEWFVEVGRTPDGVLLDDVFATVREPAQ